MTPGIFKDNFRLSNANNDELDLAFVRITTIYEHTTNKVIRELLTECIQVLAKEITRRDNSLQAKFENFIYVLRFNNYLTRKDKINE